MSTYAAVFALVLAYVATVAAFLALRTLAKVRASGSVARGAPRPAQVPQALVDATNRNTQISGTLAAQLEQLRTQVETSAAAIARLSERNADQRDDTSGALRNIALVRY